MIICGGDPPQRLLLTLEAIAMPSRTSALAVTFVAMGFVVGCDAARTEESEPEDTGQASEALNYLSGREGMLAGDRVTAYGDPAMGTGAVRYLPSASAYRGTLTYPEQFVILSRSISSPHTLSLFRVGATPADPLYGKLSGSGWSSCGASACVGILLGQATTLWSAGKLDYALFTYERDDTSVPGQFGSGAIKVLRANADLSNVSYMVQECAPVTGLTCRVNSPAIAASTRHDGTDRALVSYFLEEHTNVDDWKLVGKLMDGNGVMTSVPSVSPCSYSPCDVGESRPVVMSAYNALENKFLVVAKVDSAPYDGTSRARGQIYDGTTGALGPTVDFGLVDSYLNSQVRNQLGVASNPDPVANPQHEWTVLIDGHAGAQPWGLYRVRPDGSLSAPTSTPYLGWTGGWTLQWVNSGTETAQYEWLSNNDLMTSGVFIRRVTAAFSGFSSFDPDGSAPMEAESMAFSRGKIDLSVWSGKGCPPTGACAPYIYWRSMSR